MLARRRGLSNRPAGPGLQGRRRAAAGALRPGADSRDRQPRRAGRPAGNALALPRAAPARGSGRRRLARRAEHAGARRGPSRRKARDHPLADKGRRSPADRYVQGARRRRRRDARGGAGRQGARAAERRERGRGLGGVRRPRRHPRHRGHARRNAAGHRPRSVRLRRRGVSGAWIDRRRRRGGARGLRAARLVRRFDASRAVPYRGQEDDGIRAGGAAGVAPPRRDRVSDGRRRRAHRHVEGVRRAARARLAG